MNTIHKFQIKAILVLSLLIVFFISCKDEVLIAPTIEVSVNGTAAKSINTSKNQTFDYSFKYNAAVGIKSVRLSQISNNNQTIVPLVGDPLSANEVSGKWVATSEAILVIDVEAKDGGFSSDSIKINFDFIEIAQAVFSDYNNDMSKCFFSSKFAYPLFHLQVNNNLANTYFGFAYTESKASIKGAFISLNQYSLAVPQATFSTANSTIFRKVATTTIFTTVTTASDIETAYNNGTELAAIDAFTAGSITAAIKKNDVFAFKTSDNKFGMIMVNLLNSASESALNNQTVTTNIVIQK
jgi:hypothetical protein